LVPELRFAVLGPVRAWRGDTELELDTPQQRAVLAGTAAGPRGRATFFRWARLVDALWGDEPPNSAVSTVRTYVSRLRHRLGTSAADGRAPR